MYAQLWEVTWKEGVAAAILDFIELLMQPGLQRIICKGNIVIAQQNSSSLTTLWTVTTGYMKRGRGGGHIEFLKFHSDVFCCFFTPSKKFILKLIWTQLNHYKMFVSFLILYCNQSMLKLLLSISKFLNYFKTSRRVPVSLNGF